ncbi:MAG: type polyketide synthase [Sediminibacterium sp.]|nr:type polyketide synthase [Sediminibacterium sp.]
MQEIYGLEDGDKRKLKFLYDHSGIAARHSIIGDYGMAGEERTFIPAEKDAAFPALEQRMEIYDREAVLISKKAIEDCIQNFIAPQEITHLVTVSCTGMSAPGLDLQLMEELALAPDIFRTSVNFMGCYAAIHALKMAKMICDTTPEANVVIVATELCTLHFQKEFSEDNAASSLLFADGCAAVLISNRLHAENGLSLKGFYSYVAQKGKADMAWQLSSKGFLMTLSGYVPQLIQEDVNTLVTAAVKANGLSLPEITHWCIHPGGKRILDMIQKQLQLPDDALCASRKVLSEYGNMSSPTVLFVLKELMDRPAAAAQKILGMAFGPGLTMETFIAER